MCGMVKKSGKDFHKTQLGRGGKFTDCNGGCRKTEFKPQQPLSCMIFTDADPRYAGRLDNKQGGDTVATLERVREDIAFNAEMIDLST